MRTVRAIQLEYLLIIVLGVLISLPLLSEPRDAAPITRDLITIKDRNRIYITRGYVEVRRPLSTVSAIINDFGTYREWALAGLDGTDPNSTDSIGLLKDIAYDETACSMTVVYDINLRKPFGSYGNTVELEVVEFEPRGNQEEVTYIVLAEEPTGVEYAALEYVLYEQSGGALIRFTAQLKFAWYVDMFFSLEGYREGIEWRIERFLANLHGRIRSYATMSTEPSISELTTRREEE
jgi:hypothetical protein